MAFKAHFINEVHYLLLMLLASSKVFPSLCVFFVISEPARSAISWKLMLRVAVLVRAMQLTDKVNLSLFANKNALLAFSLNLGRDMNRQDCVGTWRMFIHHVTANKQKEEDRRSMKL